MSATSWWEDDDVSVGAECEHGHQSRVKNALQELSPADGLPLSCRIAATSNGPWWADGWSRHKEDFDIGLQASPRTRLIAKFDPADVQKGEMLALGIQKEMRSTAGDAATFDTIGHPFLRALVREDAAAIERSAEQMLHLLHTNKITKVQALLQWSENLTIGSETLILELATCVGMVLEVHGMENAVFDRAFSSARTRVAQVITRLVQDSSANSVALISHGMVPHSDPPIYLVAISDMTRAAHREVRPLVPCIINCLHRESSVLEKQHQAAAQRAVDAVYAAGEAAEAAEAEVRHQEAEASKANKIRQESQLLQEALCHFLAEAALQAFARPDLVYLLLSAPGCFQALQGVLSFGTPAAVTKVCELLDACVHVSRLAADLIIQQRGWLASMQDIAAAAAMPSPPSLSAGLGTPAEHAVNHDSDACNQDALLVQVSRHKCALAAAKQRLAAAHAAENILRRLAEYGLLDEAKQLAVAMERREYLLEVLKHRLRRQRDELLLRVLGAWACIAPGASTENGGECKEKAGQAQLDSEEGWEVPGLLPPVFAMHKSTGKAVQNDGDLFDVLAGVMSNKSMLHEEKMECKCTLITLAVYWLWLLLDSGARSESEARDIDRLRRHVEHERKESGDSMDKKMQEAAAFANRKTQDQLLQDLQAAGKVGGGPEGMKLSDPGHRRAGRVLQHKALMSAIATLLHDGSVPARVFSCRVVTALAPCGVTQVSRALNLCPSVLANLIHLAHELARALQTPGPTPTPQGRYASALPTGNEALDEFLLDLDAAPQGALKHLQLDLEASVCAALYALARLGPVLSVRLHAELKCRKALETIVSAPTFADGVEEDGGGNERSLVSVKRRQRAEVSIAAKMEAARALNILIEDTLQIRSKRDALQTPQTAFHVFKYRFAVATRPAT